MLLSCLKDIFAGCRFYIDTFFFFSSFQVCCSLVHWLALLLLRCYCPLNSFKISSLTLFFYQFFMTCLGVFFFVFTLLGVQWISQIFGFIFFNYYFFRCIFFCLSLYPFCFTYPICVIGKIFNVILQITEALFIFKPFYPVWALVWRVCMDLYLSILMFLLSFLICW